jgi:solute carrier family 13 (sodium-dependent dicarboxylate transporter), member 2/3/5
MPLVFLPILNILPATLLSSLYVSDITFLLLSSSLFGIAIDKYKLHNRISLYMLSKSGDKNGKISEKRIIFVCMCTSAFISMFISNTISVIIMLPIVKAIIEIANNNIINTNNTNTNSNSNSNENNTNIEIKRNGLSNISKALVIGIAYAANVGGTATLTGTAPNLIFVKMYVDIYPSSEEVSYLLWFLCCFPTMLIFLLFIWYVTCKLNKISYLDGSENEISFSVNDIKKKYEKLGKISSLEIKVFGLFALTIIGWITRYLYIFIYFYIYLFIYILIFFCFS